MHSPSHRFPAVLALCVMAAACSSSKSTAPTPTGSLTVTVKAADATPAVVVTGPNGFTKTITNTQTLSGLALGSYVIAADSTFGEDSIVGTIIDTGKVTGSPATVTANATASASVSYGMKYRVGGMWVATNVVKSIFEYAGNQLKVGGTPTPAESLVTAVNGPAGLALDANGNMWESDWRGDSLLMYTPAARNATDSGPSAMITSTALATAENLTFDAHGNLWVAACAGPAVLEFTASQLAAGGAQTPTVTIQGGSYLSCPFALAFDSAGNLWVTDWHKTHVMQYGAAQLAVAGTSTPTPIDSIGSASNSLDEPTGIVLDASGNMWVSNYLTNTLVKFSASQVASGGAPAPQVTVTVPSGATLFGLAMDKRGTLWTGNYSTGDLYGFTSAQLTTTGAPTPAVTIVPPAGNDFPEQLLFDPFATASGVAAAANVRPHVAGVGRTRSVNRSNAQHQ